MTWTDARIAELSRLWGAGVSASGIAEALGEVSRSAVLGKLHRLGLLGSRKPASAPRRFEGAAARPPRASADPARQPPRPTSPAEPPLPSSPWREAVFAPLQGTTPRPWLSREFGECAFPAAGEGEGVLSCCAPARPRSAYCAAHHRIVFRAVSPDAQAAEERWLAGAVERWAA
jgi:GcrA cell cycle regulator